MLEFSIKMCFKYYFRFLRLFYGAESGHYPSTVWEESEIWKFCIYLWGTQSHSLQWRAYTGENNEGWKGNFKMNLGKYLIKSVKAKTMNLCISVMVIPRRTLLIAEYLAVKFIKYHYIRVLSNISHFRQGNDILIYMKIAYFKRYRFDRRTQIYDSIKSPP